MARNEIFYKKLAGRVSPSLPGEFPIILRNRRKNIKRVLENSSNFKNEFSFNRCSVKFRQILLVIKRILNNNVY